MNDNIQDPEDNQRQGVAQTVNGVTPSGSHVEIGYHHDGKYWFCNHASHNSFWCFVATGQVHLCERHKLRAKSLEEAIIETRKCLKLEFAPLKGARDEQDE